MYDLVASLASASHWSTTSPHRRAKRHGGAASEVSLESPIIMMWSINEVKKEEQDGGRASDTDNVHQPPAANVTEEARTSEEIKIIHPRHEKWPHSQRLRSVNA